jgi:hypothetical protein
VLNIWRRKPKDFKKRFLILEKMNPLITLYFIQVTTNLYFLVIEKNTHNPNKENEGKSSLNILTNPKNNLKKTEMIENT